MNILVANNTLRVELKEDIDHSNTTQIRKIIDDEINKRPINKLIFDFSDVEFMDSSGIGMILGRYKTINAIGGTVYINNPNESVMKIINISGLNKIIPIIYDSKCEVEL